MPSPVSDLREWIALLEKEGELVRVTATVDPDLEITEIAEFSEAGSGRTGSRETGDGDGSGARGLGVVN